MHRRLPAACLAAAATAALAALPGAARAAEHTVEFASFAYTPNDLAIGATDSVRFNGSFAGHPLVWDFGDFPVQSTGSSQVYDFTGRPAGTYGYHCRIHGGPGGSGMAGRIVIPGNTAPPAPAIDASPASPQTDQEVTFTATAQDGDGGTIAFYDWDLDGNGSFERRTTTPTTTRTYSQAGTFPVGLRVIDDGHDVSPVTTRQVTVTTPPSSSGGGSGTDSGTTSPPGGGDGGTSAPPAGPAGTGTTGPGGGPAATTTAPRVLAFAARTLRFRAGSATLRFTAPRAGRVTARVRRGKRLLARGSAAVPGAGARRIRVRLTAAGRRHLRAAKRRRARATLVLTLRDARGVTTTVRRTLTIRL